MPISVVKSVSAPPAKRLDEAVWQAWVLKSRVQDERDHATRRKLVKWMSLAGLLFAVATTTLAGDLSKYRGFQFGTDLPTVAGQAGVSVSQVKVIHSRPAVIQELEWRPQTLGASAQKESADDVVFSFYNGELYRIAINYDRYELDGLSADDVIDAVSVIYGPATRPTGPVNTDRDSFGGQGAPVASWQDAQYAFNLVRSPYGPSFMLIGVQTKLATLARAAILEAKRLDDQEAPQRDAAREAGEQEAARARLEKARLVNKPRFRP